VVFSSNTREQAVLDVLLCFQQWMTQLPMLTWQRWGWRNDTWRMFGFSSMVVCLDYFHIAFGGTLYWPRWYLIADIGALLETKRYQYAYLILALTLRALNWFSQNLPAAWRRCDMPYWRIPSQKSTDRYNCCRELL